MNQYLLINLMWTIGLNESKDGLIFDQDSNTELVMNGKNMSISGKKGTILFDPIDNLKLSRYLFSYYISKLSIEEGVNYPLFYYNPPTRNNKNITVTLQRDNTQITSKPYLKESLCYLDLIFALANLDYSDQLSAYNK